MKKLIKQQSSTDRIFTFLSVRNNTYYTDDKREEALEILIEEFSQQLDREREIDRAEKGWTQEEINRAYGSEGHQAFLREYMIYILDR